MSNIAARPQKEQAIALAINTSFGNSAIIWTPYLYPASEGPEYYTAWSVNVALMVMCVVVTVALRIVLQRENKLRENEVDSVVVEGDVKDGAEVELRDLETREVPVRRKFQI